MNPLKKVAHNFLRTDDSILVRMGLLKGLKLAPSLANGLQRSLGLSEWELHKYFRLFSKDAVTALDIGAEQGEYTIYFLKKTNVKFVHSFEAMPDIVQNFQKTLVLNGADTDARLTLHVGFVGCKEEGNPNELDALAPRLQGPCVAKMDVERNELSVLKGATQILARSDVSWIIEIHTAELMIQCKDVLEKAGFKTREVGPAWWRLFVPETRGEYVRWLVASKTHL